MDSLQLAVLIEYYLTVCGGVFSPSLFPSVIVLLPQFELAKNDPCLAPFKNVFLLKFVLYLYENFRCSKSGFWTNPAESG